MRAHPTPRSNVARSLLGDGHPLVAALADVDAEVGRLVSVAAVLGAAFLGLVAGRPWGGALALAAGLVGLVLAVRLIIALDTSRQRVRDVLVDGRERIPVEAVQRQRRRLLDPKRRRRLAEGLEASGQTALRAPAEMAHALPGATPEVVAAVGEELRAVARALRAPQVSVRGVAIAERLLTDITSPLYGSDVHELRCQLARIRWHLATAELSSPAPAETRRHARDPDGAGASHGR